MRQRPVRHMNQALRVYRPFTGPGVGVVVLRHEFSVWLERPYRHGRWCTQYSASESDRPFVHGSQCHRDDTPQEAAP